MLNQQPRATYGTPFPLQHLNSGCYDTPNIVYKENLWDVMTPAYPQRDPPLDVAHIDIFFDKHI